MGRNVRYFEDGNTVRKIYEFPERERKSNNRVHLEPHRRTYRHIKETPRMSLRMTMLLAASVLVSVFSCIQYLGAQADIAEVKESIAGTQTSLDTITTQNDCLQYEIDSFVDVEHIMKVAKEELGMVMVKEEQIVTYDSTRSEYMEQYADVPEK